MSARLTTTTAARNGSMRGSTCERKPYPAIRCGTPSETNQRSVRLTTSLRMVRHHTRSGDALAIVRARWTRILTYRYTGRRVIR